MNFTAKSRYALKIMMDLGFHASHEVQQREDIAMRAGIPSDFMDQITVKLKSAGLIESVRGRRGGYKLARHPADISAFDIFAAVEGESLLPVACLQQDSECGKEGSCISRFAWEEIYDGMMVELRRHRLDRLIAGSKHESSMMIIPEQDPAFDEKRECLPPRKIKSQAGEVGA